MGSAVRRLDAGGGGPFKPVSGFVPLLPRSCSVGAFPRRRMGKAPLFHHSDLTHPAGRRRRSPGAALPEPRIARTLRPPPPHLALDLPHMAVRLSHRSRGLRDALPDLRGQGLKPKPTAEAQIAQRCAERTAERTKD